MLAFSFIMLMCITLVSFHMSNHPCFMHAVKMFSLSLPFKSLIIIFLRVTLFEFIFLALRFLDVHVDIYSDLGSFKPFLQVSSLNLSLSSSWESHYEYISSLDGIS